MNGELYLSCPTIRSTYSRFVFVLFGPTHPARRQQSGTDVSFDRSRLMWRRCGQGGHSSVSLGRRSFGSSNNFELSALVPTVPEQNRDGLERRNITQSEPDSPEKRFLIPRPA